MTEADDQTVRELLSHRSWLFRLAQQLVRDEAHADDLCQEAMLQAFASPVRLSNPRSWLARAVKSLGLRSARDDARRRRREQAAVTARAGEAEPSAVAVLERVAMHRRVVDAVMRLDELYRAAVLLRYWEDLPPREVARRLDLPVETVRTRLKRGLAQLRLRLDQDFDGRGAWVAPLLALHGGRDFVATTVEPSIPVPGGGGGLAAATCVTGAAIVKTHLVLFACGAVLLTSLLVIWGWSDPEPVRSARRAGSDGARVAAQPVDEIATPTREAVGSSARRAAELGTEDVVADARQLRGRVLGVAAHPVPGVRVRLRGDLGGVADASITDDAGYFTMPHPGVRAEVVTDEVDLATVLAGVIEPAGSGEPVIVATRALGLSGVVVDEAGNELAGALVRCVLPRDFRARFGDVLDYSRPPTWTVQTGDAGRFELLKVGRVPGAVLRVSLAGYLATELPQPDRSSSAIRVTLTRPVPVPGSITGQVVDAAGAPVEQAHVSLGGAVTMSGEQGRFLFDMGEAGREREVLAMKRGYLPGRATLAAWEGEFDSSAQPFVTVALGGEPLAISGLVVDARRRPLADAKVWVVDPTVFGSLPEGLGLIAVEGYLGGGLTRAELWERFTQHGRPTMSVDRILDTNPTAKWNWVRTDASGRFTLTGLLNREYTVAALVPDTLVTIVGGPIYAGTDHAVLMAAAEATVARVAGRVVSSAGQPVPEVRVQLLRDTLLLRREVVGTDGRKRRGSSGRSQPGRSVVTDESGRFEFRDVGTNGVYLALSGDQIMPTAFGRDGEQPPELRGAQGLAAVDQPLDALEVRVSLRLHLRVELADAEFADRVSAVDAAGKRISLWVISGDGVDRLSQFPLHDGRSEVLSAPESVTTVVLHKQGREVRRIPVALVPGQVNVVRD
ncbi:MAG: sigma-70 family RNA polymerase sigma factor [bacterium]|nr:sigma-70 family RNA polymerase sigma factor [bacterium]